MKTNLFILFFALFIAGPAFAQQGAQQFEKFNLQGYDEAGSKSWDVKGDTAQVEGDTVHINKVDANHYGEQKVNLTAEKGELNKASGNIHLEKDVVITAKDNGGQLKTDYLDWDKNKDLVKTDAPVVITNSQQGMTATGTGLEAHPNMQTAKMQEDVTVKVNNAETKDQTITITCDGPMELDQKNNKATFSKNVVAVQGDRTIKSDLMEVYFDPEAKTIKEAVCTGHVKSIQGGNSTDSEKAVYNGADQKLTLIGKPKLIMVTGGEGNKDILPSLKGKKAKKDTLPK